VPDPDDKDDESFVDHLIDDSVVSNPQSSEAGELSLQFSGEPSLRFS
jgi:hypothetical protein